VGTVPDRQFAPEYRPAHTTFATTAQEVTTSAVLDRPALGQPQAPQRVLDREQLLRQQERIIRRNFTERTFDLRTAPLQAARPMYRVAKRVLDLSLAIPALVILSPVMLALILLIRMESTGPAIFRQQRVGKGGQLFCMYKFRSMTDNAGVRLNGIHKTADDDRITAIGRFIRKTSLDELPQLVNVILGHMSLVGPRPELPEIVLQRYQPWQYRRLEVPQGITGWWQVTGRGKKLLWKHTADDLYYVDRASIWFDLKLLFMTVKAVFSRDGAF
jgi:lipopolysaccharide/colanic/teichoic acid biosynthesis glycosyltransferase